MSEQFERLRQLLSCGATSDECLFYDCHDDIIIAGGNKLETFKLPMQAKYIKKLSLIYVQDNHIILKKDLNDLTISEFDDSLLYFKLSENDTMRFNKGKAEAQLKVLLNDGEILVSAILKINVVESLDDMFFNNYDPNLNAIQANVNGQDIKLKTFTDIVANINNIYNCEFIFDSTWDNLSKYILFKDEYNNSLYVELLNNNCKLPKEVLTGPGNIYVGVIGFEQGSPKRSTMWSNSIRVIKSCNNDMQDLVNKITKNINTNDNSDLDSSSNNNKDDNNKESHIKIGSNNSFINDVIKVYDGIADKDDTDSIITVGMENQGPPVDVITYKKATQVEEDPFIDKDYSYTRDNREVRESETNIITISLSSLDGGENLFSFDLNSNGDF